MTDSTRVRDLFQLPDQVRKGDFVVKLAEGIRNPAVTAGTYVVTPALAAAFDNALGLVSKALRDARSHAAYLHGSFGSGKSHFMALLSLLVAGNEDAWRIPELHALRSKYPFAGDRKLLQLHFHMIGQPSIEAAVFGGYLDLCEKQHQRAPIPPLFADEGLFADAKKLLDQMGDAAFFAKMNEGAPAGDGWGSIGQGARWDHDRFDVATRSNDPDTRAELFDGLARSWFSAFTGNRQAFEDLDSGLAIMTRHAESLGYEGIVLFLDEMMLWLAARASEPAWLHTEAQKMVKLVEAQEALRPIPIISFVARQRDLAELVGEQYAGDENARLRDALKWCEGRFDKIILDDRNLPAIVEKRVLVPRNESARKTLDECLRKLQSEAGPAWTTLLGQDDREAFRKLYPFSPALVDALVALSNSLQRERTAIKLLMEIMLDHIGDLQLGEVVRVGDLFDVLAGGEDTADGIMKSRFESAKHIYQHQFLPAIREANGTFSEERCQRLRPGHPERLGCAECPEKTCRTHNRLAKTLILAALVPEVASFRDLTAGKLVRLNHGTLKTPIPGTEATMVAGVLRDWSAKIGQLRVGAGSDPTLKLELSSVNVEQILDQARSTDTPGGRQQVLRDLLFETMGIPVGEVMQEWSVEWRSTVRKGLIRFGNVRKMAEPQLRCPDACAWHFVVDYPFDEPGHGPNEDVQVVDDMLGEGAGTWTLVWLPSFFSETTNRLVGDVVVLNHVLATNDSRRQYVSHLTVENQTRAMSDLDNLRSSKRAVLRQAIEQAYGLVNAKEGTLDSSRALDRHLYVLKPGAQFQPPMAPTLEEALRNHIQALLEARYPRHPRFTKKLTPRRVENVLEQFGRILDSADKRIAVDRELADEMRGTLEMLGLVRVTETAAHLVEDRLLQEIEQHRNKNAVDHPTAADVRRWLDEGGRMGLLAEAQDLVVRAYSRWASRTLARDGRPFTAQAGTQIPDDVVLLKPELPTQEQWNRALDSAAKLFGITFAGRALHAENLQRFDSQLEKALDERRASCAKLPSVLTRWGDALGVGREADRFVTASSADHLCAELADHPPVAKARILASFEPKTSPAAVAQSMTAAPTLVAVLDDPLVLGVFRQLQDVRVQSSEAGELVDRAAQALRQDEINVALAPRLRELAQQGQVVGRPVGPADEQQKPDAGRSGVILDQTFMAQGKGQIPARLREAEAAVRKGLEELDESACLELRVTLRGRKKK
jgi:hypothetical protein